MLGHPSVHCCFLWFLCYVVQCFILVFFNVFGCGGTILPRTLTWFFGWVADCSFTIYVILCPPKWMVFLYFPTQMDPILSWFFDDSPNRLPAYFRDQWKAHVYQTKGNTSIWTYKFVPRMNWSFPNRALSKCRSQMTLLCHHDAWITPSKVSDE